MTQEEFFRRYTYDVRTDKIGGGGFGTVYRATDNLLHRTVAIKVSEEKIVNGKEYSLRDEFNALRGLPIHPNIANYEELYSFDSRQGIFDYAVMQYYPDGNLASVIGTPLSVSQKEDIATQLLDGIGFLHAHNVVHRDLKPGNILVVRQSDRIIPIITDFGLSKTADTSGNSLFNNSLGGVCTPRYGSPEQLLGAPQRFNTDLWSYGVIVYELFTGEQLFGAANERDSGAEREIYNKIVSGDTGGRLANLPAKWRRALERCLVVDSSKRVKNAEELMAMIKVAPASDASSFQRPDPGLSPLLYGPPPSSYDRKEKAEQALFDDTKVDIATSREPSKPEPEHSDMASQRNPRKPDAQRPANSPSIRKIPLWAWIVGGIALVAVVVALTVVLLRSKASLTQDSNGDYVVSVGNVDYMMKKVEGGEFTMGCTSAEDDDCNDDERPSHSVTLSGYWIGETEVTQALWKAVMWTNPSDQEGDNLPVNGVAWDDCQEFIRKLNSKLEDRLPAGWSFALPTEAQWEYAARGGIHKSDYKYAGSDDIDDVAWYAENSGDKPHPVKGKKPNALGLYDMSGNVNEWCLDWYGYYSGLAQSNPLAPESSSSRRVVRGGDYICVDDYDSDYSYFAKLCRVSCRDGSDPGFAHFDHGFRLVLVQQ